MKIDIGLKFLKLFKRMSYQNLIQIGQKPYQNLDVHDLKVRGETDIGTLTTTTVETQTLTATTANMGTLTATSMSSGAASVPTINGFGGGVSITEDLSVDTILPESGNQVSIQQYKSHTIAQEYGRYTCNFTNIGDINWDSPPSWTLSNSGAVGYIPQLSGVTFTIPEAGVYSFSAYAENSGLLGAGLFFGIRVYNTTTNEILGVSNAAVQNSGAVGDYLIGCNSITFLNAGVSVAIQMRQTNSPGGLHAFFGRLFITRIK